MQSVDRKRSATAGPGRTTLFASLLSIAMCSACNRRPPEPPSAPQTPQPEIPADASIRLITDPVPASPPRDAGPALLPIGNEQGGDPMHRLVPIAPDASAAPFVPR